MFRAMRRKEKQLSDAESIEILNQGEYGVLSTIGEEGYPYGVPVNYVWYKESVYFHCATSGHKIENIENTLKVSFCVVTQSELVPEEFSTKFKSVVLFGKAKEVFDEEKQEGLMAIVNRFSIKHAEAGKKYIKSAWDETRVFKIVIEHMTSKGTKTK